NEFKPLITRINPKQIEAMKMAAREDIEKSTESALPNHEINAMPKPQKEYTSIEDFDKIDLRVAKILSAEKVEGADKLLRLQVDLGSETRQILAGIKAAYLPQELVGRKVVIVANLAPRKMRFGVSEGMILVAGSDNDMWIISPDEGAPPGARVK